MATSKPFLYNDAVFQFITSSANTATSLRSLWLKVPIYSGLPKNWGLSSELLSELFFNAVDAGNPRRALCFNSSILPRTLRPLCVHCLSPRGGKSLRTLLSTLELSAGHLINSRTLSNAEDAGTPRRALWFNSSIPPRTLRLLCVHRG